MVRSADLHPDDVILEIGAGFGTLTFELAKRASRMIAVELDRRLAAALATEVQKRSAANIEVIPGDIFSRWRELHKTVHDLGYKIVANLPYNITSRVLGEFVSIKPRPSSMTVMVQKEVAERVVAAPGKTSVLSIVCQLYGEPRIASTVPASHFWPQPSVDSAILHIAQIGLRHSKVLGAIPERKFFQIVRIGFAARRKQLQNNLANGFRASRDRAKEWLRLANLSETVRAQDLSVQDWTKLAKIIAK